MSKSFTLVRELDIPELNATARLYNHKRTGARLFSVINDDDNKVFSINFRTAPKDSTGVAHILEHSVLGGSEKYPVKEPFVELLKGSLATFVNAFTFPDKTCYPVASQNVEDFYNLIDVYMDAVLHPRITPETLMQEGWHYEITDPSEPMTYKGVVFNEMKGAYSSPDGVLETRIYNSLFPRHVYGVDSGGDPHDIPNLTYENFKAFHETFYHPSNAFIYYYGNDDPENRLALMENYLKSYKKKKVKSAIPDIKPFKRPKKVEYPYDAGSDKDIEKKNYLVINWMLPVTSDPVLNFSFRILGHILIGTPASPLKKALLDSGLGEDLAGVGMETELKNLVFSTGLRGTKARHARKIEKLILDTLTALAREGIDPDMVAAAMNTIEFRLRENNTGAYPVGIALMRRILTTWIHDEDPFKLLAFASPLEAIKKHLQNDNRYFEKLIQTHLLDNVHRTILRLKPDPEIGTRVAEEERTRLANYLATLNDEQVAGLIAATRDLKKKQEAPDSKEALDTLPILQLSDLEKTNKIIPIESSKLQETEVLHHDLFTNGILYLDLGFDLHSLSREQLPLAGIFTRLLFEMGTMTEDFVKFSQRIGKSTGGIHASTEAILRRGSKDSIAKFFIRGKATVHHVPELLEILKDILLTVNLDHRARLKQIVLEEKASLEAALIPNGHSFALTRLDSELTEAGWINEQTSGISQLFTLRELADDIDHKWKSVLKKFEALRDALINRKNLIVNVTVDGTNWKMIRPQLDSFLGALPSKPTKQIAYNFTPAPEREAFTIPSQVNYVAKGADLYDLGYEFDGSAIVVTNYLSMTYVWEKLRVQGGAYGGYSIFDDHSGVFAFFSYRDPNLAASLEHYDKASSYLKGLDSTRLTDKELTKAIIRAIARIDAYQLPDAKGYTSMIRYLSGDTEDFRQKIREQVLSTNGEDFIAFGETIQKLTSSDAITVIGSQTAIESANIGLKVTKVL
jgi:Zn-dependent M16 (insulinase) family peptidase